MLHFLSYSLKERNNVNYLENSPKVWRVGATSLLFRNQRTYSISRGSSTRSSWTNPAGGFQVDAVPNEVLDQRPLRQLLHHVQHAPVGRKAGGCAEGRPSAAEREREPEVHRNE